MIGSQTNASMQKIQTRVRIALESRSRTIGIKRRCPRNLSIPTHGISRNAKTDGLYAQKRGASDSADGSCVGNEASSSSNGNLYLPASQLCRSIRWHREEQNGEYFSVGSESQIGQFIAATRLSAAA